MSCYGQTPRLATLEKRTTSYRWDLEKAPAWSEIDAPGVFASLPHLRDLGVEVDRLGGYVGTFDWIYAATTCRTFEILEEQIIDFVRREGTAMLPSRSLELFLEEEEKHVALFRRFCDALLVRHSADVFDLAFAPARERLRGRLRGQLQGVSDDAERHYFFWANAIFFEEYTVYLHGRLAEAPDVQPTWASLHRLHRIEELQHLATDEAYLDALRLDAARKKVLSQRVAMSLLLQFQDTVGISTALHKAHQDGLGQLCPEGKVSTRPFFRDVLSHPAFRRTREAVPYLDALADAPRIPHERP